VLFSFFFRLCRIDFREESGDMQVTLADVTEDNWEEVVGLKLKKNQRRFVASNAYSLAESKFNKYCHPRAIYYKNKVVGFIMYESMDEEAKPYEYFVYRFMVKRKYQGKGIGQQAMMLAIEEIKANENCKTITICYASENKRAKKLYRSCGFEEIGLDEDGQMIAKIDVIRA
jgi:diamine N-acetyltransferase